MLGLEEDSGNGGENGERDAGICVCEREKGWGMEGERDRNFLEFSDNSYKLVRIRGICGRNYLLNDF